MRRRHLPQAGAIAIALLLGTAADLRSQRLNLYGLLDDARAYRQVFDVSDSVEAVRRLRLQRIAGDLEERLRTEEASSFAGLWIEHEPRFRVVVAFADEYGAQRIARHLPPGPLLGLVETQRVSVSLAQLERDQANAHFLAQQLGLRVDSAIRVQDNVVELYALNPAEFLDALAGRDLELPETVLLVEAGSLAEPMASNLYGGLPLTDCTSGFAVVNGGGARGILTAGHCQNPQSYSGLSLTFQGEACGNGYDVQWHTSLYDEKGWFWIATPPTPPGEIRAVTATKAHSVQTVGEFVCKQGRTTGYTCGTIQTKSYQPSYAICSPHTPTYVRVSAGGANRIDGGDSGGPVFSGNTAYGIANCEIGERDLCYMAIDFASTLGVSVVTSDSYPPPPPTCEEACYEQYEFCEEEYCYWNYNQFMCQQGCSQEYSQCLSYC